MEDYGIHPKNFAVARAIAGDKSDNLKGIPGAGLPTIKKRLPFLEKNKEVSLTEIVEYCRSFRADDKRRPKFYEAVTTNEHIIRLNYRLMQLYNPNLSAQTQKKIDYGFNNFAYDYNRTEFIKMMTEDGFGTFNWTDLYAIMNRIAVDKPLHTE